MTDEELTNRFGSIDGEFADAKRRFESIDEQLADARSRFEDMDRRFEAVDQRFEAVDQRFDAVDRRFDRVEASIKEEGITTRRHFDVVAEKMVAEIRLIAEGHEALRSRVDRLEVADERLEARQDQLDVR